MAIVISSQKMYSLVNNFEDQPVESLMKKRRDTTFSISCWFWSLKRKRLRQNWRGARLVVDISAVATTSPLLATIHQNWWLQCSHKPKYWNIQPHRNHQLWRVQWNLHHIFVLHHYSVPPGTSWWKTNRITLHRRKLLALSRHSPARGSIVLAGAMRYMSHMTMVHARDTSVNIQR